ncbi:hypothetical protein [Alloiococcus otitis]|uniref:hypothetical protein n=1 Tax=Alloiococcus otitis TaxID=1652 RepID=UPI002352AE7A|nr:hypothetical protein [Alloiococcus otitis]
MVKVRQAFTWIYFIMYLSLLWFTSVLVGLVFFSFIPACVTAIQQIHLMKKDNLRGQLALGSRYYALFFDKLKEYYLISLAAICLLVVLVTNYLFLSTTSGFVTYLLFYLTIAMILAWFWIVTTYSVVASDYSDISMKEQVKNSMFIVLSHLLEFLIVAVIHAALALVLWAVSPLLVVFVPVIGLILFDYLVGRLLNGFSIRSYFSNFINSHE